MHSIVVLALISQIAVFFYLKPWRLLVTFVPALIMAIVSFAMLKDRLAAYRGSRQIRAFRAAGLL